MTIPTIFDTCRPRIDVLRGAITEADFAADLATAVSGKGSEENRDPVRLAGPVDRVPHLAVQGMEGAPTAALVYTR